MSLFYPYPWMKVLVIRKGKNSPDWLYSKCPGLKLNIGASGRERERHKIRLDHDDDRARSCGTSHLFLADILTWWSTVDVPSMGLQAGKYKACVGKEGEWSRVFSFCDFTLLLDPKLVPCSTLIQKQFQQLRAGSKRLGGRMWVLVWVS